MLNRFFVLTACVILAVVFFVFSGCSDNADVVDYTEGLVYELPVYNMPDSMSAEDVIELFTSRADTFCARLTRNPVLSGVIQSYTREETTNNDGDLLWNYFLVYGCE